MKMTHQSTENTGKTLKDIDFVAWQVTRAKKAMHRHSVNRVFNARSRLLGGENRWIH